MRRILAIPFFITYLIAVSGMIVRLHYCASADEHSWALQHKEFSSCCAPQQQADNPSCHTPKVTEEKESCCSNHLVILKVSADHDLTSNFWSALSVPATLPTTDYSVAFTDEIPFIAFKPVFNANAPPGNWQYIPLYTLHHQLQFYS